MSKWPKQEDVEAVLKDSKGKLWSRYQADESPTDRVKRGICAEFIKYMRKKEITQRELAKRIGVTEAIMSKITHYHFDEFTIDRLYGYLNKLDPAVTLGLSRKNKKKEEDEAA